MCPTKKVLHVECTDLECGLQTVHGHGGIQILNKMAGHGDWPWHAALFKEDVHVCDGTLVSPDWLITTASCFQGQPKAEWTARLGTVRLAGTSPWQQERRIVGLVKSPVEGSTVAMVKLEQSVYMSDFVRPICLPKEKSSVLSSNMSYCNTLGWARNREQLQRVQLKITEMEKCENVSITTVNSVCTESAFSKDDCNVSSLRVLQSLSTNWFNFQEEELAGSPMLCLLPDGVRWSLVGVSNWRIACSKIGVQRPRMYDKITSNVDWIHQTISAIS